MTGIRDRVAWCIDQFVERGECDLVRELASAVPASVTIDWLGLPDESWPRLSKTMHDIAALNPEDPRWLEASKNLKRMYTDLTDVIAERRSQPRDDVISLIVWQEIRGAPISPDDALGMVGLLVAGGVDTTTSVTSSTPARCARTSRKAWPAAGSRYRPRSRPVGASALRWTRMPSRWPLARSGSG